MSSLINDTPHPIAMKPWRVGYTTGVFDLFHIGHLNVLKKAKAYCERLIVGVSTDELVSEYKKRKPVICFDERIEIVRAIRYVDEVYPQITMDKLKAWEALRYDVLFHGDDWKGSLLYERYQSQLSAVGVQVVFLPHTEGISSTRLAYRLENESEARE
jgi:glycerol-3-phosphate cytidylyltransferase